MCVGNRTNRRPNSYWQNGAFSIALACNTICLSRSIRGRFGCISFSDCFRAIPFAWYWNGDVGKSGWTIWTSLERWSAARSLSSCFVSTCIFPARRHHNHHIVCFAQELTDVAVLCRGTHPACNVKVIVGTRDSNVRLADSTWHLNLSRGFVW